MENVNTFLKEIEDADPARVTAAIKKVSEELFFSLYRCLQYIATPEAVRFTAWLGRCFSAQSPSAERKAIEDFGMQFVPELIWLHLDLLSNKEHREVASNVECCLVCLYNKISKDPSFKKDIRLARLEHASIYHEASSRLHISLTVSALQTQANLTTVGRDASSPEHVDRIIAATRSSIVRCILLHFCETIASRCKMSLVTFCHMCTRVCVSGFDLQSTAGTGIASASSILQPKMEAAAAQSSSLAAESHDGSVKSALIGLKLDSSKEASAALCEDVLAPLAERPRHSLAPEVFQQLAAGVHVCMFNGQEPSGMQALNALHWRASESLIPEVLVMTRALLHALKGPCGTPDDGFFGLSAQTFSSLPKILQHSIMNRTSTDLGVQRDAPHISVQEPSPFSSKKDLTTIAEVPLQSLHRDVKLSTHSQSATAASDSSTNQQVETLV